MSSIAAVYSELRALIRNLGTDGGSVGPSVYDSARLLSFDPGSRNRGEVLTWLLAEQQDDGGWGDPATPLARDVPTLAALVAVAGHGSGTRAEAAVARAVEFLHGHAGIWQTEVDGPMPVGVELLVPQLLREARHAGLDVPLPAYARLLGLGRRRRPMLRQSPLGADTPQVHCWEALGLEAATGVVDRCGSVGNSPAATAAWLRGGDGPGCRAAARYLRAAAVATGVGVSGVVPTVWPIERFEHAFGLYALHLGRLLDHAALRHEVSHQVLALEQAMTPEGLGISEAFRPDADVTAAALAVLAAAGRPADVSIIDRFDRQRADGRNGSWIYLTLHALVALIDGLRRPDPAIDRGAAALLEHQRPDGGWGTSHARSNAEETAYAVLALRALARSGVGLVDVRPALIRGEQWMRNVYRPFTTDDQARWLGKETYRPRRVVRVFELAATVPMPVAGVTTRQGPQVEVSR